MAPLTSILPESLGKTFLWLPRRIATTWRAMSFSVARRMPKRLYARSLIIVIAPMILLQSVVAFVFMERHWQTVTQRLSTAVVRDIAALIDMIETFPQTPETPEVVRIAQDRLALKVDILPPDPLPPATRRPFFSILDSALSDEITRQINRPFWIDTVGNSSIVEIRIRLEDSVLRVFARRNQTYASNTHIFLLWMAGSAFVLITIAVLFLRNQIRPIQQLAAAADAFGKGQGIPDGFRPRGAEEVRRAGSAFLRMKDRIERQIEQRTAMLTGVSHDLRTILTRFRLQLAVATTEEDLEALRRDIDDMQSMLEGYLSFARGDTIEDAGTINLNDLFGRLAEDARLRRKSLSFEIEGPNLVDVRPIAFSRLVTNIVSNALQHAKQVQARAVHSGNKLEIVVDDNGPGIPEESREDVFKPFVRLDRARNLNASGTGLGLAIARDLARAHGGDIMLEKSPLGGLRAVISLPV